MTVRDDLLPVPADPATIAPVVARELFREGLSLPTTGWCDGYAQANLLVMPRDLAYDVLLFAQRNPVACPVIDVGEPGEAATHHLARGADLRTDLPAYRIWEDGRPVAEVRDARRHWCGDLVAFLIGCSFTAESALREAGVPLRHQEQGVNVPMYVTARPCRGAGALHGPLVVTMRPVPADRVAAAVRVTARYPTAHGAPVHIGDPARLGIADLARPDFGDPVAPRDGDVPVFWACGVTSQAMLMASRPPFAITHAPGHMFITDVRDAAYQI